MLENNEQSDFITYPKTFEKYKWYKPILVFIIAFIIYLIFGVLVDAIFGMVYGEHFINSISVGGYETLNNPVGEVYSDFIVIIMIPSLYIASKIVRDRPFSSYVSTRGGWNYKLYFKALIIPFVLIMLYSAVGLVIGGKDPNAVYHFSWLFLIVAIIFVPLQCIAEEYVFRGFFMQTFGAWFKIPVIALILQSILFTAGHGYDFGGLIEIFVAGIIYGVLTWKTGGIEVSSALHTANNFVITLFSMFGIAATSSTTDNIDAVITIVFNIVLFLIIYYVGKKTDWYGEIPQNS